MSYQQLCLLFHKKGEYKKGRIPPFVFRKPCFDRFYTSSMWVLIPCTLHNSLKNPGRFHLHAMMTIKYAIFLLTVAKGIVVPNKC